MQVYVKGKISTVVASSTSLFHHESKNNVEPKLQEMHFEASKISVFSKTERKENVFM